MAAIHPPARPVPPRARIAFRVGVVGHRPDRLPGDQAGLDAVRERIGQVLSAVARSVQAFQAGDADAVFYSDEAPMLTANSPLAEGADRLFAGEALRLGYDLYCVMPFAQADFEADFRSPEALEIDSLGRFRDLLKRAGDGLRILELDGDRTRRSEAYQAAGRIVLNQSDLLIVVWDGGAAKGVGGTLDTLREAIAFEVPALWIDSRPPFGWKLLRSQGDLDRLGLADDEHGVSAATDPMEDRNALDAAVFAVVEEELTVPRGDGAALIRSTLAAYLRETRPRYNPAFAWKLFRDLLGDGVLRPPPLRVRDYVEQIKADWPIQEDAAEFGASLTGNSVSWINGALRSHYAWSDKLADRYADAHRSGFLWSSLLAVTAVFVALLPMAAGWRSGHGAALATAIVEALVLVLMVGLPLLARRRRWHQRWMEYRVQAEMIRELRILAPLGGGRPLPRTPAHLANYGDPTQSWMYWQMRAVGRVAGAPNARIDDAYLDEQAGYLLDFLGSDGEGGDPPRGQIGFHRLNCERLERIHRRLHQSTLGLFCLSIIGVLLNWFLTAAMGPAEPGWISRWLILISAVFPALGAALASIDNQGEFARLQRRSRAMAERFADVAAQIPALRNSAALSLAALTDLASRTAGMMIDENVDWRIVVLDLPHAAG